MDDVLSFILININSKYGKLNCLFVVYGNKSQSIFGTYNRLCDTLSYPIKPYFNTNVQMILHYTNTRLLVLRINLGIKRRTIIHGAFLKYCRTRCGI